MKKLICTLTLIFGMLGMVIGQVVEPTDVPPTTLPPPPTYLPPGTATDTASAPAGFTNTLDSLMDIPDRFNFFVAGNPAFKLVDLEPSTMLRPSTPSAISLQVSEFWSGSSIVIPSNMGLQVSPFMVIQSQLKKPSDWAKAWQPLSIGVAASRPDSFTNTSEFVGDFSVGLQYTLLDNCGERHFENSLRAEIAAEIDSLKPQFEKAFIDSIMGLDSSKTATEIRSSMKHQMDAYVNRAYKQKTISTYNVKIAPAKKRWKAENWASQRFNIAAAASWNAGSPESVVFEPDVRGPGTLTADTLLSFPSFTVFRKFESHLTYTLPFPHRNPAVLASKNKGTSSKDSTTKKGKQWGMWMIGLTYGGTQLDDTSSTFTGIDSLTFDSTFNYSITTSGFYQNIGLANRFYVGSHRAKAYLEGQLFWDSRASDQLFYLADLGVEINIMDGIWIQLYAGVTNTGVEKFVHPGIEQPVNPQNQFLAPRPHFLANFDLRLTIPESFYNDY